MIITSVFGIRLAQEAGEQQCELASINSQRDSAPSETAAPGCPVARRRGPQRLPCAAASSAVQTHLMNGFTVFQLRVVVTTASAFSHGTFHKLLPENPLGKCRKISLPTHRDWSGATVNFGQLLQCRCRGSIRQKSDVKFLVVDAALLQEGIGLRCCRPFQQLVLTITEAEKPKSLTILSSIFLRQRRRRKPCRP